MTITIPFKRYVRNDIESYEFIIELIERFKNNENHEIIFDFQNVNFFEANLCTLLGVFIEILERKNNIINFKNIKSNIAEILQKNKFLIPFGYKELSDNNNTSLTYKQFTSDDDGRFNNYIKQELLDKKDFPKLSNQLGKEIIKSIYEIYENARTHGRCDLIHVGGQFFPQKPYKPLNFTIVDKGVNIKENVSNFLKKDMGAAEAIDWAMKKGNTTKTGDTSGGLGLGLIFDFITLNKGKIQVISSDGFYEYYNDTINKNTLSSVFEGTIINITFNLNDKNEYRLVKELDKGFENIF